MSLIEDYQNAQIKKTIDERLERCRKRFPTGNHAQVGQDRETEGGHRHGGNGKRESRSAAGTLRSDTESPFESNFDGNWVRTSHISFIFSLLTSFSIVIGLNYVPPETPEVFLGSR
jgi:hypothetical protein